jgi:nicotinamidase-related amidase
MKEGVVTGNNDVMLVVDVQHSFRPPDWLIHGIRSLLPKFETIATVEQHDEGRVPFEHQLGWHPAADDESLIAADRVFVKHGYLPPREAIDHLIGLKPKRVLVCGIQAETCVLAAGFALFDAGLYPTLIADLVVGSSLDPIGELGIRLWQHHFGAVIKSRSIASSLT